MYDDDDDDDKEVTVKLTLTVDEWARISALIKTAIIVSENGARNNGVPMPDVIADMCRTGEWFIFRVGVEIDKQS